MEFIGYVDGNTFQFPDTSFGCPSTYSYRVLATDLCGNVYSSFSDTASAEPPISFAGQIVEVVRSTVVDNSSVLTEWLTPTVLPEKVVHYDIYRSTDNSTFDYLTSVPAGQTEYLDLSVEVQHLNYYYRVVPVNACNITESPGTPSSTIVLEGEMDENYKVRLQWTPYTGWEQGVDYYVIEKQEEDGSWTRVRQVDGTTTTFERQE
jgi:hypothetical protein